MVSLGAWNEKNFPSQKRDWGLELCDNVFQHTYAIRGRPGVRPCGSVSPFGACIHSTSSYIYFPSVLNESKLQIFLVGHKAQGFPPPAADLQRLLLQLSLARGYPVSPGRDRGAELEVSEHVIKSKCLSPHCNSYFLLWSSLEVGQDHNNSHKTVFWFWS